jgi:hypothetical protein
MSKSTKIKKAAKIMLAVTKIRIAGIRYFVISYTTAENVKSAMSVKVKKNKNVGTAIEGMRPTSSQYLTRKPISPLINSLN